MERHENVTQGATDKQERQAARSSTDEYLREASRLSNHDRDGQLDDLHEDAQRADPQRVRKDHSLQARTRTSSCGT